VLHEHFRSCTNSRRWLTEAFGPSRTLSVMHGLTDRAQGAMSCSTKCREGCCSVRRGFTEAVRPSRRQLVLHELTEGVHGGSLCFTNPYTGFTDMFRAPRSVVRAVVQYGGGSQRELVPHEHFRSCTNSQRELTEVLCASQTLCIMHKLIYRLHGAVLRCTNSWRGFMEQCRAP